MGGGALKCGGQWWSPATTGFFDQWANQVL
jgi:hypothetical protein